MRKAEPTRMIPFKDGPGNLPLFLTPAGLDSSEPNPDSAEATDNVCGKCTNCRRKPCAECSHCKVSSHCKFRKITRLLCAFWGKLDLTKKLIRNSIFPLKLDFFSPWNSIFGHFAQILHFLMDSREKISGVTLFMPFLFTQKVKFCSF